MQQIAVKIYDPSKETPGKPGFKQTIRYIFQYIDFAISEDEANVITSLFVEIWDSHQGQNITDNELKQKVYESCRNEFVVFLSREKIDGVVSLILSYLRSIHQY
jgi:hypothetical protein